ncbi:uncharacterized protein LOC142328573 isoform X3 [Lycorma delicatula]|uniref:uncharacterized protein LOC142328573 isoform X3 n=1 Tax=Lycorma delicatula TaxID=130591 RepID=UPI003F513C46
MSDKEMKRMDDPVSSEQFSLRWNNFHSNLTSEFHALLQGEDLVDVTIAANGKFVQAHKIVLSVCSPYFKELFKINPCKHPIVILQDVGYTALCGLLQFMYCGEVSVCQDELADFLKTAELLQVKGLTGSDSQEQTKSTLNKRPLIPETKRKSKMPRRIILGDHGEQDIKDKIIRIEENTNPSLTSVATTTTTTTTTTSTPPLIVPKTEPTEYSEIEEIESSADHSIAPSGETSGSNSHTQQGHYVISNISPSQDQLQDGTQVGFRTTSRGRLQLVHYGFIYHCNRQKDDKIFWKCAEYNKTGCRGRCITVGESITVTHPYHNHKIREESNNVEHDNNSSAFDGCKPFWDSEMITLAEMNVIKSLPVKQH